MVAPFAALEARVNAAVFAKLANATADFGSGVLVDGIFREQYAESFGILPNDSPTFEAGSASLAGILVGAALSINGTAYAVASKQPDGTGKTLLALK